MSSLFRILFAITGLAALALAILIWFEPAGIATQLGVAAQSPVGVATLRADVAGFFAGSGVLALLAAIRSNSRYALAVLILLVMALLGRVLNVALSGWSQALLPSMVVEAVLIVIFAAGYRRLA